MTDAVDDGYERIRHAVALLEFPDRGVLRLRGTEATSFLQGLVTNDVERLTPGTGCRAAILTPLGKVVAVLDVLRPAPDELLLLLQDERGAEVAELLERYHFAEDVEISDVGPATAWFSLQGPAAPAAAEALLGAGAVPEDSGYARAEVAGYHVELVHENEVGVPAVHVLAERSAANELRPLLRRAAEERGGGAASRDAWEMVRVESGVPWTGAELDNDVLPMEAGLASMLNHEKGCYVGQEVVARATVRGRTNWSLWRLRAAPGTPLDTRQELTVSTRPRPVIHVRSVVPAPRDAGVLALAYVHREVARPGPLRVVGAAAGEFEVVLEPLGENGGDAGQA